MAARATGTGIGLICFMLTWLIGNQLSGLIWDAPAGMVVAFVRAVVVGTAVAVIAGGRLARR